MTEFYKNYESGEIIILFYFFIAVGLSFHAFMMRSYFPFSHCVSGLPAMSARPEWLFNLDLQRDLFFLIHPRRGKGPRLKNRKTTSNVTVFFFSFLFVNNKTEKIVRSARKAQDALRVGFSFGNTGCWHQILASADSNTNIRLFFKGSQR